MPPLITIVGETASGKSALAMELAERFEGELIAADSWTVYRDFDIGTAKPTPTDREKVKHYLLDVADPSQGFNVVQFQQLAKAAIADIMAKGKLPIVVGGTGLYIDSILYDYVFLPPTDPDMRAELNSMTLPEVLHRADMLGLDTTGIDLRNKRRVIRLIENNGARPTKHELRPNTLILGMATDRHTLRERVTARVKTMCDLGLGQEVLRLAEQYGWQAEPMKGIGYREWIGYFEGSASLTETQNKIIKATMDLAKRQRTWFKRNDSIQWLYDPSNAVEIVTTFLNKSD